MTKTIRIHDDAYDRLKQIAKSDRRDMIDILDLLLLEVDKSLINKLLNAKEK
jgi:predicted CopG family antitoxin